MSNINIFTVDVEIDESTVFYNIRENRNFKIDGIYYSDGKYRRLPEEVAQSVSPAVHNLHARTTGGRVRFKTDSSYIAIKVVLGNVFQDSNTTVTAQAGFDMYVRKNASQRFMGVFMPPYQVEKEYVGKKKTTGEYQEYVINFPIGSEVEELYIGLEEGATLEKPDPYTYEKPIVFYGSSITMGKCATRPGCSYENILSQRLDFNFVNLGFGGAARGEQQIADYIAGLDMRAFVLDYDHNSPSPEHLTQTHERFFKTVREAHKEIPIIIMSRPKKYLSQEDKERKHVIEQTYLNALEAGDKNVYFIPGDSLMNDSVKDCGTVDGTHPTDAGFFSMADAIEKVVRSIYVGSHEIIVEDGVAKLMNKQAFAGSTATTAFE